MSTTIRIKRSGNTVSPTTLASGELAYSWESSTGGKFYLGWGDELTPGVAPNIAVIGGKYFTDKLDHTPGTLTANSAIIVDANSKIDQLFIDNIHIDGNTISSAVANTNIILLPGGSKTVDVSSSRITSVAAPVDGTDAVNKDYLSGVVVEVIGELQANNNLDIAGDSGSGSIFLNSEILTISGGTGLSSVVSDNTVTINLDNTGVVANTYGSSTQIPVLTINAQGQITVANTASVATTLSISGDTGTDSVNLISDTLSFTGGTGITTAVSNNNVTITGDDATTTTKGIASFADANFTVVNGAVSAKSITLGSTSLSLGSTTTAIAGLTQLDVDNIRIDGNTISSTNTNGNIILDPNGTGVIDASSSRITAVASPVSGSDAATKTYVDTVAAASIHYHAPVRVESPVNLVATYDNGTSGVGATLTNSGAQAALVIDGITLSLNDRVLVYQQTNPAHNGVYTVTNVGSVSTNWVLTRATDTNSYGPSQTDALGQGDAFFVKEGNTGAGELYVMTTAGEIIFGTTPIVFTQISAAQIYQAGDGLSLNGVTFNVNVDNSSIEINNDILRVKAAGITNAMLAGSITNDKLVNSTITFAAETGTADPVALGETVTFAAGEGINTVVSNNTITISGEDASDTNKGIASFNISDFTVTSGSVVINVERIQDIIFTSIIEGEGIDVFYDDAANTFTISGEDASITNKGIASFGGYTNSANTVRQFAVTAGDVKVVALDGGSF
jgi:hypothetical protein